MNKTPIQLARDLVGGTKALADALSVQPPTVSEWVTGRRPVPPLRCPAIQRATKGKVTCEDLRPDVDWAYLRNSAKRKAA